MAVSDVEAKKLRDKTVTVTLVGGETRVRKILAVTTGSLWTATEHDEDEFIALSAIEAFSAPLEATRSR